LLCSKHYKPNQGQDKQWIGPEDVDVTNYIICLITDNKAKAETEADNKGADHRSASRSRDRTIIVPMLYSARLLKVLRRRTLWQRVAVAFLALIVMVPNATAPAKAARRSGSRSGRSCRSSTPTRTAASTPRSATPHEGRWARLALVGLVVAAVATECRPARYPAYVERRAALPGRAALRPGNTQNVLHRVRECGLGGRDGGLQQHDVDVPATVTVDGRVYNDVGVHFRGNSSFGVGNGYKRSLNLSFDFVHDDQSIGGYRTLNFLNANTDPTLMRTVLSMHIARQYIAAPKANFVRVVINGENWGVYANAEQFNKEFLVENFGTKKGTRWKIPQGGGTGGGFSYQGDDPSRYNRTFQIKTKDEP
jgi:hypothetical protein